MNDIPEVKDTGSEGSQIVSAEKLLPAKSKSPFQPIQDAATGLASTNPRSLGGNVGAQFMAASIAHLSNEYDETKKELSKTRDKLETTMNELSRSKSDVAALTALSGVRHLKNASIAVGTFLVGFAIDFSRNEFNSLSVIFCVLGILLIAMGWITPKGGAK